MNESGRVVCCEKQGINAGVSGMIRHFPEQEINVVILSNLMNGAWKPIRRIHEMIVGETDPRVEPG